MVAVSSGLQQDNREKPGAAGKIRGMNKNVLHSRQVLFDINICVLDYLYQVGHVSQYHMVESLSPCVTFALCTSSLPALNVPFSSFCSHKPKERYECV